MSDYVAIQRSLHLSAGLSPVTDLNFAQEMTTVPILTEEIPYILQHMPIAFQKIERIEKETYQLVALQSLMPSRNLFILPDGRWIAGYTPAFYRSHPFALTPSEKSNQLQLTIKSDYIKTQLTESDLHFFDDEQNLTPALQKTAKFLAEALKSRQKTLNLCASLDEENLITPWEISFTEPNEKNDLCTKKLEGLYHIDTKALQKLSNKAITGLNACGGLKLAYGQYFSEARLKDLTQLQTAHRNVQENNSENLTEPDLDELFGSKDDLFSF